jgi:hypothetical protein
VSEGYVAGQPRAWLRAEGLLTLAAAATLYSLTDAAWLLNEQVSIALIWFAHIGFDRALGYGLKYPSAFQNTHMGRIGKSPEG